LSRWWFRKIKVTPGRLKDAINKAVSEKLRSTADISYPVEIQEAMAELLPHV
jgi:hypothetical protein